MRQLPLLAAKAARNKEKLLGNSYPKQQEYQIKMAQEQWDEAVEQIKRYAQAPRVEALRQGTTLHKIIMQFKGWELAQMKEIK